MRLTPLSVALTVLTLCAQTISQAHAEPMRNAQIVRQVIGKDLVTRRNGMAVHLRYDGDGSVTVQSLIVSASGTWTLTGDELCMTLTSGPRRGVTCHTFEDIGNGRYRNSEGLILQIRE